MKTLYLCYFGLKEPLVQTQVLPYLRELTAAGVDVYLLTFEPQLKQRWSPRSLSEEQTRLGREGIKWSMLPYHKSPSVPATIYDIGRGVLTAIRFVRRHGIIVLHARAHIPLAMALIASRVTKCALIFDIRGFMAEEYADAGVWRPDSLKFRLIKRLEKLGIEKADQLVVLTEAMKSWLLENQLTQEQKIEVIPCCVDFSNYADATSSSTSTSETFEVIYAGSVTGLYLLEEMARFFLEVRRLEARAFFRILTMSSEAEASERLRRIGLTAKDFWIGSVRAHEVPGYLKRARLGLSFRKPTFSQLAASPTKIAEYLAAGIPVVSNAGIGDVDKLLQTQSVGVVVQNFTVAELARTAGSALALAGDPKIRERCVSTARIHFDLHNVGGDRYLDVYRRIGEARLEAI